MTTRLRLEPDRVAPEPLADLVDQLARCAGLSRSQAYWLRLAADEITTNISHHGYQNRPGRIDVEGGVDAERVWIHIEDRAPAFDPRTYDPAPRLAVEPADREAGGYGLMLALSNLDDFSYEYDNNRNHNTLIMVRPRPAHIQA